MHINKNLKKKTEYKLLCILFTLLPCNVPETHTIMYLLNKIKKISAANHITIRDTMLRFVAEKHHYK